LPQRADDGALATDRIDAMANGHKTGGRQRGTPNKRKAQLDAKFAEVAGQVTANLSPQEIALMTPLEVMLLAMRLEVECGQLGTAASIAEKAAPTSTPRWRPELRMGIAN
jgi:hypothetical protein